jgi:hypothetical protein
MEEQRIAARRELPPIENGELKVFHLKHTPVGDASTTLEQLFGAQQLRLALDPRTNSIVAFGRPDALTVVESLLLRLDQQSGEQASVEGDAETASPAGPSPRSLLVRVYWLADNLPEDEGQTPAEYLPKKVVSAVEHLGLVEPRLVTQTVNSLAVEPGPATQEVSTRVPAIVGGQMAELSCQGALNLPAGDRTKLQMRIQVAGGAINCELSGSLSAPLGHYMVLGTANSVTVGGAMAPGMAPGMMDGAPGGEMGFGIPGAGAPAVFGGAPVQPAADGAMEGGGAAPAPKFTASRFAFVVQVIEGESYAGDESDK